MSDNPLLEIAEVTDAPISAATGIAALALNFSMKYHDISTVQDGTLYQQYKLEGKNMQPLHLDMIFETARQIEVHIMSAPNRLSEMVIDAIVDGVDDAISKATTGEAP